MFLLPSKKQWKSWSLPSKLTAVGTLCGVIGLVMAVLSFQPPFISKEISSSEMKNLDKRKRIESLFSALHEIETLLPINSGLKSCVDTQRPYIKSVSDNNSRTQAIMDVYGSCKIQLDQQHRSARQILQDNNEAIDELLQYSVEVRDILDKVSYFINEFDNNYFFYEVWLGRGCSETIKIVAGYDRDKYEGVCMATVTVPEDFWKRYRENNNNDSYTEVTGQLSAATKDLVEQYSNVTILNQDEKLNSSSFIVNETTITNYTAENNDVSYGILSSQISELRKIANNYLGSL